jgi:protein kinase A
MFVCLADDWNFLQTSVYCVMEYMEGGTLHSLVQKMKRLPESVAKFYAAEIILAVSFLHECGIVHR